MKNPRSDSFLIAEWQVSPAEGLLTRGREKVRLEPRAMEVLVYFASRPGEVITREELERDVWEGAVVGYDAVTNTVIKLRKAFGDDARRPRIIQTVPKRGYRLLAEVREAGSPDSPAPTPPASSESQEAVNLSPRRWWVAIVIMLGLVAISLLVLEVRQSTVSGPADDRERLRLVVLPFENLGAGTDQDYFSNGLTDDLITELSGIPGLAVIANDSAFVYQGDAPLSRLRKELDIQYVLRGSVRRDGSRIRINIRLIEAAQGQHLWAKRYEKRLADTFVVQDEIVEHVATSLRVSMRGTRSGDMSERYRAGMEAYDYFLRGKQRYGQRSRTDLQAAEQYFLQAVRLDPEFARAHAALALVYLRDVMDAWTAEPSVALQRAQAAAERATELDAGLPEAHFVNAVVALFERRYEHAVEALDRALALRPSYADAYATLAWVLHFAGRAQEGRSQLATAMQLNPHVVASYLLIDGGIAFTLGETETAIARLKQARDISPTHPRILLWLAAAYARGGHVDEASWIIQELRQQHPAISLSRLDDAFPFQDREAMQMLRRSLVKAGLPE